MSNGVGEASQEGGRMRFAKYVYGELTRWYAEDDEVGPAKALPVLPL